MSDAESTNIGFTPDEIRTGEPTRSARLKWVILVDESLPVGRATNAAICVAAATVKGVTGLLGPSVVDATGSLHHGLPWAGCSVLAASSEQLTNIRAKAVSSDGVYVADMPEAAQATRVYDEFLEVLGSSERIEYRALSIVGPRNRVDKLVNKLSLLS